MVSNLRILRLPLVGNINVTILVAVTEIIFFIYMVETGNLICRFLLMNKGLFTSILFV